MPLEKGSSRATFSKNVSEMVKAGHGQKQAVAAAYREAGEDAGHWGHFSAAFKPKAEATPIEPRPAGEATDCWGMLAKAFKPAAPAADASFSESDHPRAENGQFGGGHEDEDEAAARILARAKAAREAREAARVGGMLPHAREELARKFGRR